MQVNLDISVIIFGSLIVLGLFSALILMLRTTNKVPNILLSIFLIAASLWHVDSFMNVSGIYSQFPDAYFKPIYYSFAFGPLIYFYVKSITNNQFKLKWIHLLHFIPVIIQAALYFFLALKDYSFKRWYWLEVHRPYTYRIEFDGTFISLSVYLILSIIILNKYQGWLKENFSESSKMRLNWLKIVLVLLLMLCVQWFVEVILRDFYSSYYEYNYSTIVLGLLTLVLAIGSFLQINLSHISFQNVPENKKAKKKIEIEEKNLIILKERMVGSKDYLNPTLTLKSFAENCQLPMRIVSEHINHGLNKSFQDFVNEYRVEEVKARLKSNDREIYTLESIAYDSGFNSKATFNRIFKKFTGKTPTVFQQSMD